MEPGIEHVINEVQKMPIIAINETLLFQVINFLIMVAIFKIFFLKPIGEIIEKRKQKVALDIEHAKKDKEESIVLKQESEKQLKEARVKAQAIMSDAIKKSEEIKEEIIKQAQTEREKRLKAAEAEALKMKEQVKKELRDEMTEIAIKLAEKMIKEKMNVTLEKKLIDDFIEEVGKTQ